jgi:hypothetical protein
MNDVLPPPPTALNDALALVRLALNPKEAADYLDKLSTQAALHESARNANTGKEAALEAREKVVQGKESDVAKREASVTLRETDVASHAATLKQQQIKLTSDSIALEAAKALLIADREKLAQFRINSEQTANAAHQAVAIREAALVSSEAAYNAKVARLKELV